MKSLQKYSEVWKEGGRKFKLECQLNGVMGVIFSMLSCRGKVIYQSFFMGKYEIYIRTKRHPRADWM